MSAMPDSKYCSHCQKDRPMTLFMGINHSRNAKKPGEMDILRTCNECRTKAAKKVHASRSGRSTCSGRSTRSGRSTTAQRSVTTEAPDVVPVRKVGYIVPGFHLANLTEFRGVVPVGTRSPSRTMAEKQTNPVMSLRSKISLLRKKNHRRRRTKMYRKRGKASLEPARQTHLTKLHGSLGPLR